MKKRLSAMVMMLVLLAAMIPYSVFATPTASTKAQVVSSVSFRDQPSTSSNVMRYLKTTEKITLLAQLNPYWYQAQDQYGKVGYVTTSTKYISILSNSVVVNGVNFRTGPSTSYARIRFLPVGEELQILEKVNDSWYKAEDVSGVVGYVSSSSTYLSVDFSVTKPVLPLDDRIESFINEGMKYMGTPYEFGSDRFDTTTFDCSDFVQQSFWDATRTVLPSDSSSQGDYVKNLGPVSTDWHNLKRGDLMFFMSYAGSRASDYSTIDKSTQEVTHVAIYLGNGQMLQTYSPASGGVRIDTIGGNTWEYRFLYGGSVTN